MMKKFRRRSVAFLSLLLCAGFVTDVSAQRKQNPAFAEPEIQQDLPNVLLIGDSISIGYMLNARAALAGKANVFRPATNCGPTTNGVKNLDSWLGDRHWDVIHFNFGLHDLKYMGPNDQNLADPESEGAHQQVPIDQYAENIKAIAQRLKKTGAKVIWRETSPVPEGAKGRVPGDSAKYNAAAARAIEEVGGIQTDPFFEFAMSVAETQRPANVHYTSEGSKKLGQHVAEVVEKALQ
ncbi:SGNH/GDSL hydrolase family protein [Stieleria sp. JC731]|uniref:SGNH/GDSL hydrolase family protein n=1 Tax=Pirellulaceae TaxID=2691357 RepID=UPI001E467306|nr:SGNH/GDSL hydrolase family protein [Stieleria sp. JC731]MCC9598999.1 SGNH/GDSL hydrolase family protein [Stieleria sp. JC731]